LGEIESVTHTRGRYVKWMGSTTAANHEEPLIVGQSPASGPRPRQNRTCDAREAPVHYALIATIMSTGYHLEPCSPWWTPKNQLSTRFCIFAKKHNQIQFWKELLEVSAFRRVPACGSGDAKPSGKEAMWPVVQ